MIPPRDVGQLSAEILSAERHRRRGFAQVADTSLLGLGDFLVRDVERRQPRAGRLDSLLSEPQTATRYEVEIQLGPTDEAHIIRTIEYWDLERRRYPQYEHVAVIVAEDITSRFLNVISLFNGLFLWSPSNFGRCR